MPKVAAAGPAVSVPAKPIRGQARPPKAIGPAGLPPAPENIPARRFREKLMAWYREHARVLPWRGIQNPYATWLSEIMLQQTRVATVIDRYGEFLRRFPTLASLAAAPEDDVLALWSGLGYYRRARMLHRGAQFVVRELDGELPPTSIELRTLPGVGEYTAAAIASIAFGESIAVVDGNVERVLLRLLGLAEDKSAGRRAEIHAAAQALVPAAAKSRKPPTDEAKEAAAKLNPPGDHNQAMMELGATICLPREPLCLQCPVVALCRTRGEHATQPRGRQQSRLAAHLLAVRKRGRATEVLLERRPVDASLMPGMLELPPLPLAAVEHREPVLRLRHAITNTNYVVQIYSEGVRGTSPEPAVDSVGEWMSEVGLSPAGRALPGMGQLKATRQAQEEIPGWLGTLQPGGSQKSAEPAEVPDDDAVFVAEPHEHSEEPLTARPSLLAEVPASSADLAWMPVSRLRELPLTGLARKCLQRLHIMSIDIRHKH